MKAVVPKNAELGPASADENYATEHRQRSRFADALKRPSVTDWIVMGCTVIIAGCTAFYSLYAAKQWRAMNRSNDISAKALTEVQRALVSPAPTESFQITQQSKKVIGWQFNIGWENDGTTAAKTMFTHVSTWSGPDPLAVDFSYPDIWPAGETHAARQFALGPKAKISSSGSVTLSTEQVNALLSHPEKWYVYLWGWTTYRDVFYPETPTHLTEFCLELDGFRGDPLTAGGNANPLFGACINKPICYDADCADYKERTK